eukprot:scaffold137678_cov21-Tisochrysis_lutea.AAC.2
MHATRTCPHLQPPLWHELVRSLPVVDRVLDGKQGDGHRCPSRDEIRTYSRGLGSHTPAHDAYNWQHAHGFLDAGREVLEAGQVIQCQWPGALCLCTCMGVHGCGAWLPTIAQCATLLHECIPTLYGYSWGCVHSCMLLCYTSHQLRRVQLNEGVD